MRISDWSSDVCSSDLAKRLKEKERKKVLMASLDVNRPAAQEQLAVLGTQIDVATLPIVAGQQPVEIAKRAMQAAKLQGYDVLMLDTAGRSEERRVGKGCVSTCRSRWWPVH